MKCPHCNYEDVDPETYEPIGIGNSFYKLPIEMKDSESYYPRTVDVYGCPECKKVFIS